MYIELEDFWVESAEFWAECWVEMVDGWVGSSDFWEFGYADFCVESGVFWVETAEGGIEPAVARFEALMISGELEFEFEIV